ncbi:MAG: S41 family peptidase, partial [Terracidiphilus sp.]
YNHAGALAPNSSNPEVKLTDSGRTVYGGGGLTPDEKIESTKTNRFQDELSFKNVFFEFAPVYVATHTVDKDFQVNDAVMSEFKKYLTSHGVEWTDADINGVSDWIKARIKKDIETIEFGQLVGLRVMADADPEVQKALTYMPEAQALEENAHKVLAEKAQARATQPQGAGTQP